MLDKPAYSYRLLILLLCCFSLGGAIFIPTSAQDQTVPVKGCGGRIVGSCRQDECRCTEWWVDYYGADGKVWGAESAKTLEALKRKIESSQKFDRSWARWTGEPVERDKFNHQHPSQPICVTECVYESSRSRESEQRGRIEQEADDILGRVVAEWGRVSLALVNAERRGRPYASVGLVLSDYANTLRDVIRKQKELREKLQSSMSNFGTTLFQLDGLLADLKQADSRVRTTFDRLPTDARALLAGGKPEPTGGNWMSQRIPDFDGRTVQQNIRIDKQQIVVSYRGEQGAIKTYTFAPSDLSSSGLTVQRAESGRWVVIVSTLGRRITQTDSGLMGGGGSEFRSRVILYFNTESEARDAANAISAGS